MSERTLSARACQTNNFESVPQSDRNSYLYHLYLSKVSAPEATVTHSSRLMGNQVTTLSQIYPVEFYLADYCNDLTLDANLGSTRFMKVARVKHRDAGLCVAKVYALNDPNLPIIEYRVKLEQIRDSIRQSGELHSLPFSQYLINEKSIILLRQYIKYNLYDRLSTRPFLTFIEKQWIAYQLLRCIHSLHDRCIYHGDIKSENILVTSFLWVTLADFASYKPITLPQNNPSDFSYFFDTSRRHCCNMAPERFVDQGGTLNEPESTELGRPSIGNDYEVNQLTPQMDMFSLGCVLAELFSEDTSNSSIFDLGQVHMYKNNQYDPTKFLEDSIADPKVRGLILNMIDLDPHKRNSASHHLDQLVPSLFPAYFKKLYDYIAMLIPLSPDSRILTLDKDLDKLMEEIIIEHDNGLLLPLILATSTLRSLEGTDAKLTGIRLCVRLVESSPSTMSEYIVDRLLPYIISMLSKSESRIRACCVSSLNDILKHVDKLPASDSNAFIDYILPQLAPLTYDNSTLVRIALASDVSVLAEISKRFLDPDEQESGLKLNLLRESFGSIVSRLLVDPSNNVRRALLNENISKLCDFLGAEKTDEVILSHIITFLNDKSDFRLRAAFFDNISLISTSLGPYYAPVVKPLMQKGLTDSEEIVIHKCLKALSSMTSLKLLTKEVVYELFQEAVPFLSFPNKWIRNAAMNFVLVLSKSEDAIDFPRRILPAIKLHLHRDILALKDEVVLFDSLQDPLPRVVIESILNGEDDIDEIFNAVTKRKLSKEKKRYRTISNTGSHDYDSLDVQSSFNIDQFSEDKLIDSELILRRIHKNKRTSSSKKVEPNICVRRQDAIAASMQNIDSRLSMPSTESLGRIARPRGILLAHLHEHKSAVNKLIVIPGTSYFASCSNDATIKFWDCAGVAARPQVLFRSKQTVISPDAGAIKTISVCPGTGTLLSLTDNNNLHLMQIYSQSSNSQLIKTVNFSSDISSPELVTDLVSLSPFTYTTSSTSSYLRGYDLRLPTNSDVWSLKLDGKDGLITCLDGNEFCIACGTSSSIIALFDLRFYIQATTMSYPPYQDRMKKRVRRILLCNHEVYCSVDGNNEVSTWDCESAMRTKTLWASTAPCLSSTHSSHHSVLSMIVDDNRETNSVITAGDDMKIRFWDLNNPHRSYVVSRPNPNAHHKLATVKRQSSGKPTDGGSSSRSGAKEQLWYQMKLVDGIQVLQETDKLPANSLVSGSRSAQGSSTAAFSVSSSAVSSSASGGQQSSNASDMTSGLMTSSHNNCTSSAPLQANDNSTAHHDSINCLATMSQPSLLLSASRDGVIKIWR